MANRGQTGASEDAEEIRLADVEALGSECGEDVGECAASATEFTGSFLDRHALGRGLSPGVFGEEEGAEVGLTGEVADDGPDGADMELILVCELLGGRVLKEVGTADLVAALGGRVGLLEEAREFGGSGHRSWVPDQQVVIGQGMQRSGAKTQDDGTV
jgi:hypothetical protein